MQSQCEVDEIRLFHLIYNIIKKEMNIQFQRAKMINVNRREASNGVHYTFSTNKRDNMGLKKSVS